MKQNSHEPSFWSELNGQAFEVRWVDAGGIMTRTLIAGDPAAPPLLMVHGTGGHIESYIRNIAAHAEHFRVYVIDLIGHGWSDRSADSYEIETYVDHVLKFLDAVHLERSHMTGQSLGGWVLARLAGRHPDRVDRLVLNTPGGHPVSKAFMQKARRLGNAAASEGLLGREAVRERLEWLVRDPASMPDEMVDIRYAIYASPGYSEVMQKILCLQDPEIRSRNLLSAKELSSIRAPTLIVWTDNNPSGDISVGQEIAKLVPGARLEVIAGCGHWPQFEDPEKFDHLEIAFLKD